MKLAMRHARPAVATTWLLVSAGILFGQQVGEPRQVTVAQLTKIVETTKARRDGEAAKEIAQLELTERLSSPKLAALTAKLPGSKAKNALMAVGDTSVFLEPPPNEIPQKAVPDLMEQKQMLTLVVDYLKTIIPKLPNFYARRLTTSFENVWTAKDQQSVHKEGGLHSAGVFKATVYVRGGKEVVHGDGVQERGLITRGTFGPILGTVIVDAANSADTQWSRWEAGPNGRMAVFQFDVPQRGSHYQVSGNGEPGVMDPTAYHGEIGIDPNSGAILRLVLRADPGLGSSLERADVMVEYGQVTIGGKTYVCPVRSVSYSIGSSVTLAGAFTGESERKVTRLNDVVFSDYHVFRTEMRIVP